MRHAREKWKEAILFKSTTFWALTPNVWAKRWIRQWRKRKETFMGKTSECRFRHILTDLSDCEDAIDELFNGVTDDGLPLSDDELRAARQIVTSCIGIVERVADMAHIAVDLDVVEESIDTVLREANSAPLEARYDARDARVLLSKAAK